MGIILSLRIFFLLKKDVETNEISSRFQLLGAAAETGLRRTDVINWYLAEIENEIENESALEAETFLVKCVIDRLVKNVSSFIKFHFFLKSHRD